VTGELMPIAGWWIVLHTIGFVLFALMGVALWLLTAGLPGVFATLSRVAAVVFALFYDAGDAIAGISTGILARSAQAGVLGERAAVEAIQTLWADPLKNLLFDIGRDAFIVALVAGGRGALPGWRVSLARGVTGATGVLRYLRPRLPVRKSHLRDLLCDRCLARSGARSCFLL
jgi:hypothetical protein